jgi:hypothetical protein
VKKKSQEWLRNTLFGHKKNPREHRNFFASFSTSNAGLPDFSSCNIPNGNNIPNDHKMYAMDTKIYLFIYNVGKIVHSKTSKNVPK